MPATPAPTPTPTPEPTPILHTLQGGDTLIGLAQKYGVSVQAIQEINGITDPRGLLIGQQIIIPTNPEARLSQGTPTPAPTLPPMQLSDITFWQSGADLWALGQVTPLGEEALEGVLLQLDLLDETGAVLASAQTAPQQALLLPHEPAGFGFHFSPAPASFARYQVYVVQAQRAHDAFYHHALQVRHVLAQQVSDAVYSLSGEVVNDSGRAAQDVTIAIVLYDAQGAVSAIRQVAANPPDLAPGESALFAAELLPVLQPVADYRLFAVGRHAPEVSP